MKERIWTRGRVTFGIEDERLSPRLAIDVRVVPSWGFALCRLVVHRTGLIVMIDLRRKRGGDS